jgi:hypothetical protein
MMASKLLVASLLAAALGISAVASAEPSAPDRETARGLMTDGRTARDKGDMKAALKAFIGADAIMHVPTTGLEVAKAQAALGLLVEARETALRVTRIGDKPNDPAPFKQARDAASAMNDDLGARIPSLTVTVKNVPEGATAEVTIDDAPIPAEGLGQARKLNPGHHVVVAKAGSADAKQEIDLAEKDQKQLTVELPAAAAVASTTGGAATTTETPPEAEPSHKSGGSKVLMFGGFGLAGAGVIAGSITGILSMSKTSAIKGSGFCSGTVCGPQENSDISSAKSMATISTVAFIAAGAGAVLGVVGLLTGNSSSSPSATPEKPPTDESTSRIEPWLGFGAAGLRGSF